MDDTVDQARKTQEMLNDAMRKGGKTASFTMDQIKNLAKSYNYMADAAKEASKRAKANIEDIARVTAAFADPAGTFKEMMDNGLRSGDDLLKTFSAIAGLMFDGPINAANDALNKEKKILEDLEKKRKDEITNGEDAVKQLEDKLKKEKDFCDKVTKCDESKIKSLEDQVKKEADKVTKQKEGGKFDDEAIKDQKEKVAKAEEFLNKQKAIADAVKEFIANFADAFDRFVELDKAAAEFRKELGLGRDAARQLEQTALQLNQQFVTLGVTIEGAYKSLSAIGEVLGTSLLINKELAQTTALLAANYGVNEKNAAGFLQKMSAIGGMTDAQASAMAGFTANLANAAGVNLDEVMRDVANASDETVTMMRGNVKQMTMAAIQAKQLGVSLDKSASSAKGLLNFTQSVSDEMEASVLLGKNLNLNAARQLAFQGDAAGAQKEILNQVRSMGDFNKMNVFQQEALAKATGYSAVELTKMLKNEEKLAQLSDKEKASYEKALEAMKEQNEETGKDLLMKTQMQSAMAQLSNTFKAFKQILADILTPVVNVAVKLLIPILKVALLLFNIMLIPIKALSNALYKMWEPIEPIVQSFSDALDGANSKIELIVQGATHLGVIALKVNSVFLTFGMMFGKFINPIGKVFTVIGDAFSFIDKGATKLLKPITSITKGLASAGGVVGKFASGLSGVTKVVGILGTAGKAIPVVGQILTIIQAVWSFFSRLMQGQSFAEAFGGMIYDVLVSPFKMLIEWLSEFPLFSWLKPALPYFDKIEDFLKKFAIYLIPAVAIFKLFTPIVSGLGKVFSFIGGIVFKVFGKMSKFGSSVLGSFGSVGKIFGRFLGPIGLIITAFQFVSALITRWKETPKGFLGALKAVGLALYDVFLKPFVDIWNWISEKFVGKSNSTLGEGIIKGLIGVGSAILSIFTKPFEFIFEMIMKGFSSIGAFIQNTLSIPFKIVGKLIGVDTGGIGGGADTGSTSQADVVAAIQSTNEKLDALIILMMNGGITVNLDGRKVSEQLAIASS